MKNNYLRVCAFAAVLGVASAQAASDCATMDGYSKIREGMSYYQVSAMIGCSGEEVSSSEMMGIKTVSYMWKGSGISILSVIFQNGKLVSKSQMGLRQ